MAFSIVKTDMHGLEFGAEMKLHIRYKLRRAAGRAGADGLFAAGVYSGYCIVVSTHEF
jgi:hypothetical protein